MTKLALFALIVTAFLDSCIDNIQRLPTFKNSKFESFEISYANGWTPGFSLLVDTSKGFIASTKIDSISFGVLPDKILKLIDTTLSMTKMDSTIKTKNDCSDCSIISIKAIFKKDTIRIFQSGHDIDIRFMPLVKSLETFLDSSHHTTISTLNWETQKGVFPPPILPDNTKFKSPKR
jgi:hypothetical protein